MGRRPAATLIELRVVVGWRRNLLPQVWLEAPAGRSLGRAGHGAWTGHRAQTSVCKSDNEQAGEQMDLFRPDFHGV